MQRAKFFGLPDGEEQLAWGLDTLTPGIMCCGSSGKDGRRAGTLTAKHQNLLPRDLQGGWLGLLFLLPLQAGGRNELLPLQRNLGWEG